jgi:hypothetical protein
VRIWPDLLTAVRSGDTLKLNCEAHGARPDPQINWYRSPALNNVRLKSTEFSDSMYRLIGSGPTLELTLQPDDHSRNIRCVASNALMPNSSVHQQISLDVQCKHKFEFSSNRLKAIYYIQLQCKSVCLRISRSLYLFVLELGTVAPLVSLVMGTSDNHQELVEQIDIYFECNVKVSC